MTVTRNAASRAALLTAASALVILLASCQSAVPAPSVSPTNQAVPPSLPKSEDETDSLQKNYSELEDPDLQSDEPHRNTVDTTTDGYAETSTIRSNDDNAKAPVKTEGNDSVWTAAKPSLYGLAIGDSKTKVTKLFGESIDTYDLEVETDRIQVNEYEGFAIGINGKQKVEFIEIFDKNISAGLSGLKIGDTPEAALKKLGKPEKQTTYLLIYEAVGALLKLDLDPEQNSVVSIKLLSIT